MGGISWGLQWGTNCCWWSWFYRVSCCSIQLQLSLFRTNEYYDLWPISVRQKVDGFFAYPNSSRCGRIQWTARGQTPRKKLDSVLLKSNAGPSSLKGASGDTHVIDPDPQPLCALKGGWADGAESEPRTQQQPTPVPKVVGRPLPIIVTASINLLKFQEEVKPIMKNTFDFRTTRNGIKVVTKDTVD